MIIIIFFMGLLWKLNETTNVKFIEQCPVQKKVSKSLAVMIVIAIIVILILLLLTQGHRPIQITSCLCI